MCNGNGWPNPGVLTALSTLNAQASDPLTLPLLSSGDLGRRRCFRVLAETVNGSKFLIRRPGGSLRSANQFAVHQQFRQRRRGVDPTPVNSSDVTALPFARLLQPFMDPTEGHLRDCVQRRRGRWKA